MPSYIQNYGFTKTLFKDNDNNEFNNIVKWKGDYDGKLANLDVDINDNGNREFVSMKLNNDDIRNMFGIQPVEVSLEKRLAKDFLYKPKYKPITLEGALTKRRIHNNRKKHKSRSISRSRSRSRSKIRQHRKTRKLYYN
jgi:hypothetical protein